MTGLGAPQLAAQASAGSVPPQRGAPATLSDSALFDWAAIAFSQLFAGAAVEGFATVEGLGNFHYRFWPATGNYIGILDGTVYIYGPLNGFQVQRVAALADFRCSIYDCSTSAEPVPIAPLVWDSGNWDRLRWN